MALMLDYIGCKLNDIRSMWLIYSRCDVSGNQGNFTRSTVSNNPIPDQRMLELAPPPNQLIGSLALLQFTAETKFHQQKQTGLDFLENVACTIKNVYCRIGTLHSAVYLMILQYDHNWCDGYLSRALMSHEIRSRSCMSRLLIFVLFVPSLICRP